MKILKFLPTIKSASFIMGGLIPKEISLTKPLRKYYDNTNIQQLPPFYRYVDCNIDFLGQNVKMKLGFSLQNF